MVSVAVQWYMSGLWLVSRCSVAVQGICLVYGTDMCVQMPDIYSLHLLQPGVWAEIEIMFMTERTKAVACDESCSLRLDI